MASNYDDILGQLRETGLSVDSLEVGRLIRCRVDGDRERRGWYILHEVVTGTGDRLLVGSCGIWRGGDNGVVKLEVRKTDFSSEQRQMLRDRIREDRRKIDAMRAAEAKRAAEHAVKAWSKCEPIGDSDYLVRKGVAGHGVRYSPSGALVIPLTDTSGIIHGLQVIRSRSAAKADRRPEKEFWPQGVSKKGNFHLIGIPTWIVLIAEGYATGASLHEATGYPVAIAWDAGNLGAVCIALHKRYRTAKILVCADDDSFAKCAQCDARIVLSENATVCPACSSDHKRVNTGVGSASLAAVASSGAFITPRFSDDFARRAKFIDRGIKITDFNDLHLLDGLHVVRTQIESRISELGWHPNLRRNSTSTKGAGRDVPLSPIDGLDELLERFALVRGKSGMVFDRIEHDLISLTDMRDVCLTAKLHTAWKEHPDRAIVRESEVGFDPGQKDPEVTCNLWSGWPTTPTAGKCEKLLALLEHMCSAEGKSKELYDWVLRWIAYPIQVPGAKMKTCIVVHGMQGTGKNLFFEALMGIYGPYGHVIDQDAIEDKFNDWASKKLFMVADEVVARSELYHIKNKLKRFITGDWIRINPKNFAAYNERNHVNLVFLSNELTPVVLDQDDRRHVVLWSPRTMDAQFYTDVVDEIEAGGIAALHDHLLQLDLAGFDEHTKPPLSDAKMKLVELSLDSTSRFLYELCDDDIPGLKAMPALSSQVYSAYRVWCHQNGYRAAPINRMLNTFERKHTVSIVRKRYYDAHAISKGPHSILMLGDMECPAGTNEQNWLGECISAFGKQFADREAAA